MIKSNTAPTTHEACPLETLQAAVDQHAEAATQEGIHYGHVGSLGYIRQTLDEIQQAFRPQPVDCAPAAAR